MSLWYPRQIDFCKGTGYKKVNLSLYIFLGSRLSQFFESDVYCNIIELVHVGVKSLDHPRVKRAVTSNERASTVSISLPLLLHLPKSSIIACASSFFPPVLSLLETATVFSSMNTWKSYGMHSSGPGLHSSRGTMDGNPAFERFGTFKYRCGSIIRNGRLIKQSVCRIIWKIATTPNISRHQGRNSKTKVVATVQTQNLEADILALIIVIICSIVHPRPARSQYEHLPALTPLNHKNSSIITSPAHRNLQNI